METKELTTEKLIIELAKAIKSFSRGIDKAKRMPIKFDYWTSGDRVWKRSEINANGHKFEFTEHEVTRPGFLHIMEKALELSGVNGKIECNEWDEYQGWHTITHKEFSSLIVFGKPCKEFNSLKRYLAKYSNKELNQNECYCVNICGKRSSWSESGERIYLCYDANTCSNLLKTIKDERTRDSKLTFEVVEYISHGDEGDYKCSMYQESEWYGAKFKYIRVNISGCKCPTTIEKRYYSYR